MEKKVSRQYNWQLKQKELKRCSQCGKKAVKMGLCLICYEKYKEKSKKYMRKYSKTEKWKNYYKDWQERKKKDVQE